MSNDFDVFGDYEPESPPTLEEDPPERVKKQQEKEAAKAASDSKKKKRTGGGLYNFISLIFLLATAAAVVFFVTLYQNPQSSLNPLPPQSPQPTPTIFLLDSTDGGAAPTFPPTFTPSTPIVETATPTHQPSVTPTVPAKTSATPTDPANIPGENPAISLFPFSLQNEAVTYRKNDNGDGCAWSSIVGQVFDLKGKGVVGLPINIKGEGFESIEFTGSKPEFGISGYEVFLNSTPLAAEFEVRLLNTTGQPLSETIIVKSLSSCDQNVAIVNFVQNREF